PRMKILAMLVFAISLIGGTSVVQAQSSRDLTEPTGTEANRLRTQAGGITEAGIARKPTRRGLTGGVCLIGAGDLSEQESPSIRPTWTGSGHKRAFIPTRTRVRLTAQSGHPRQPYRPACFVFAFTPR